jgi:dihydroorotate dehydrogenase
VIYRLLRPILFRLEPERAHALALRLVRIAGVPPLRALFGAERPPAGARPVRAFGLTFPNAVGLAAGYDKDALALRGWPGLGFGHVEVGTVTPRPQPGNPRPRLFRLSAERSLINRLGFPSRGADFVARRLERAGRLPGTIVGVNLGKQRDTPLDRAAEDYETLLERFAPLADYLAVNVSSPNTPGLRELQDARRLAPLLLRLAERRAVLRDRLGKPLPVLVKLSPDLEDADLRAALEAIEEAGMDGVIATNTTLARDGLRSPLREEAGGLSGALLASRSEALLRRTVELTGGRLGVVACGGILSPEDARARLDAGASLVQLYTGLVYEGPDLARRILPAAV